jgi:chromosome segregation ATPase
MTRTVDADEVPSGPELDGLDDGSETATDEPAEIDTNESASDEEMTDSDDDSSADDTESTDDEGPAPGQRSVEMRLDHLSARVEKFGAYSSALEDFIDEHGTASEFFDRIDEDVADLETRIDGTNEKLSAEIDDVRENVDDLATEIEHVRDDVGSMREEIATLTSEVRELRSMRESLAAVLAGQDASGESDPVSTSEETDADGGAQPPTDLDEDEDDIAAAVSVVESNPSDG